MTPITPIEPNKWYPVLLVGGLIYVSVTSFNIALGWLLNRRLGRESRWAKAYKGFILLLALGALGCVARGLAEPYMLEVTEFRIHTAKFKEGTHPVRIVLFSDLHCESFTRLEPKIPGVIREQHPDIILFAGDAANNLAGVDNFRHVMTEVAKIAPTYVVKGNWDNYANASHILFDGTGVTELTGPARRLNVQGQEIVLGGISGLEPDSIVAKYRGNPKEDFTIFMQHTPDRIIEVADYQADLYLAGHTHGGQVRMPYYGALMTDSDFGKRFEIGEYRVDKTRMYVNRGIGMHGGYSPPVRFRAKPEITVIDILPAE